MLKVMKILYPLFLGGGNEDPEEPKNETVNTALTPEEVLDIKKNYVKKEDYDKVQNDYRDLVKSILDGGELPAKNPNEEEAPNISELRKELYSDPNKSFTNLEYVEKTLKLREEIIKETGKDPFLPAGIKGEDPFKTDAERANAEASAEKVAKILSDAVKEANGDPETFDVILSKIIV